MRVFGVDEYRGIVPQVALSSWLAAFSGVGLATDVQVAERPVTQQGMAGMRTGLKSAGPGRQVQDLSYYMGLLRTRISDISAELNKITAEIEQRRKDGQTHAQVRLIFKKWATL